MTRKAPESPTKSRWRKWLKRLSIGIVALLLLVGAFHRPLFFHGVRFAITKGAEAAGLKVDYAMSGSIFASLRIRDLRVMPTRPGPVEKIVVGTVALEYSLVGLLSDGLAGLLQSVELADADIVINAVEKKPEEKPEKEKGELRVPPLLPERLRVENINLVVRDEAKGDLVVKDFDFILHPTEKGALGVKQLTIPGLHEWRDVRAASASYRDRNLVIEQLHVDSEVNVRRLNLDASKLDQAQLGLALQGELFGGRVQLDAEVRELNKRNLLNIHAGLDAISLGRITTYLRLELKLGGSVKMARLAFEGNPSKPRTWMGENTVQLADLSLDGKPLVDAVGFTLLLSDGSANFQLEELRRASTKITANAQAELPKEASGFPRADVWGRLSVDAPSLADLNLSDTASIEGAVTASGPFRMESGYFQADLKVKARGVQSEMVDAETVDVQIRVRKRLFEPDRSAVVSDSSRYLRVANAGKTEPEEEASGDGIGKVLQGLEFEITGTATGIRVQDYTVESATIEAQGKDGRIDLEKLDVREGDNVFSLGGEVVVPPDAKTFADATADVDIDLSAPVLRQFVAEQTGVGLEGALTVSGKVTQARRKLNGALDIRGKDLKFGGLLAGAVNVRILIEDNVANISDFEVVFDPKNRIDLTGSVSLEKPISYRAQLDLALPDLGLLNPLLAKQDKTISGSLAAAWKGEGTLEGVQHSGKIDVQARTVAFGGIVVSEARIAGDYSPELIEIPTITVKSNQGDLGMRISLRDEQLQISNLVVSRGTDLRVTGEIGLPLDLGHVGDPAKMFPADGRVAASIAVGELRLGPLLEKGDKPPPLTGSANATLTASGTIADLSLALDVAGSNLRATALERLEPATLALSVKLEKDALRIDGTVRQPEINPLAIRGELPMDLEKLLAEKSLDENSPITLDVTLQRSELNFLTKIGPAIRFVEGTGTVNATVRGTIGSPEFGGAISAAIESLALAESAVPPVSDLVIDIRFAENTVRVERLTALLAGGSFDLGGSIGLEDMASPVFDLRLVSENALVARNDTVTVRLNTDVTVTGPLDGAAVGGSVAITNSRFFREIDILPLELPGEPAPVPPPTATGISLKGPLANWTFDVAVTTKDPFLIRSNLANGGATVDLRLVGKGSGPALDGSVKIVDFVASLPFSELKITNGFVYFSKDAPFEPNLDIQGESFLRNYRIRLYIYGPAKDAQTIFTSEPPLPQEEIISLLATGATTEELTGGSGVAAGRAAALLAQKLWRSVFKSKRKAGEKPNPFLDRFDVDIGAVDPKTGEQEVRASFEMTKRFELIGGLDIRGNARGEVRYLIRFR